MASVKTIDELHKLKGVDRAIAEREYRRQLTEARDKDKKLHKKMENHAYYIKTRIGLNGDGNKIEGRKD